MPVILPAPEALNGKGEPLLSPQSGNQCVSDTVESATAFRRPWQQQHSNLPFSPPDF